MRHNKYLFIDRDGTLIREPADFQIDSLEKLELVEDVIPSLLTLQARGYIFVIVSNQDGLGTPKYPQASYDIVQNKLLQLFESQGIRFADILICPHLPEENCLCRKPHLVLVSRYLSSGEMDMEQSAVIGDRETDLLLAKSMGIQGFKLGSWKEITQALLAKTRRAQVVRNTKETQIKVAVDLDIQAPSKIQTGIGFFDHMLDQLSKHSGIFMEILVEGDLHIDTHHTVEDTALCLGTALRKAIGDKVGTKRFGFVLPMDETRATIALDLSGRPFFKFTGEFPTAIAGEFPAEMAPHFFRSLSDELVATVHIEVEGENTHHMIEACFKGFAKALGMAVARSSDGGLPSTKGVL